jgi:hypothetical protein
MRLTFYQSNLPIWMIGDIVWVEHGERLSHWREESPLPAVSAPPVVTLKYLRLGRTTQAGSLFWNHSRRIGDKTEGLVSSVLVIVNQGLDESSKSLNHRRVFHRFRCLVHFAAHFAALRAAFGIPND